MIDKREIAIEEIGCEETGETVGFRVDFNFPCDYDGEICDALVDAEAFAEEVSDHHGGVKIKNYAA